MIELFPYPSPPEVISLLAQKSKKGSITSSEAVLAKYAKYISKEALAGAEDYLGFPLFGKGYGIAREERASYKTVGRYMNPFTDFAFKKIFAENKHLLIDLLNQLPGMIKSFDDLEYCPTEALGQREGDRSAIFDLYCKNEHDERIIIEMQRVKQENVKKRLVFYSSFPIQKQAIKGRHWDFDLKGVYVIAMQNFTSDEGEMDGRYYREVVLMDRCVNQVYYDELTFITLEMPNFKKQEHELESRLDKWLYALNNLPRLMERPEILFEDVFKELFERAKIAHLTPEEMEHYKTQEMIRWDKETTKNYVLQQGRMEEKLKIAKNLKEIQVSMEAIEKSTGLTREEILRL